MNTSEPGFLGDLHPLTPLRVLKSKGKNSPHTDSGNKFFLKRINNVTWPLLPYSGIWIYEFWFVKWKEGGANSCNDPKRERLKEILQTGTANDRGGRGQQSRGKVPASGPSFGPDFASHCSEMPGELRNNSSYYHASAPPYVNGSRYLLSRAAVKTKEVTKSTYTLASVQPLPLFQI